MFHLRDKPADEFRVVIAGSSLGLYGLLPSHIEEELNQSGAFPGKRVRVFLVGHQGMHGVELAALTQRYLALKPDVVILPMNMVDLRLERPILMGLMGRLRGPERPDALRTLYQDLLEMYGVLQVAGMGAYTEYGDYLNGQLKARAGLRGMCEAYRLKGFVAEPLWTLYDNRFSRGRSYQNYAGLPVFAGADSRELAVSQRGAVIPDFRIEASEALLRDGLHLEMQPDEATVELEGPAGKNVLRLKRGWRTLAIKGLATPGQMIRVRITPGVYDEQHADTYGARLARNTGLAVPARNGERLPRREDSLYESLSDEAYKKSFRARNLQFDRPGWAYMKALYEAKSVWALNSFDSGLPALDGLDRFRKRVSREGVHLFLYNAPENPLTLDLYSRSEFYKDYRTFLGSFAEPGYHFMDLSNLLPMQKFYDYHHLTYGGAAIASNRVADWIIREFRSQRR